MVDRIFETGNFIDKMKRILKIPEDSFLVTADVVVLYPSIPHNEGISALKQKFEEQPSTKIPTNDLVKLAEFALKNNLFEFNGKVKQQIYRPAIGTKFTPLYTCFYMDKTDWFSQDPRSTTIYLAALLTISFLYGCIIIEAELKRFIVKLNQFLPNLKFTDESSQKK